jgi:hypothetical protein
MDDHENKEKISNEIMATMKLKDEIINELYNKLEQEQQENNELKKKIDNFTFREDYSDDENKENRIKVSKQFSICKDLEQQKLIEENLYLKDRIAYLEKLDAKIENPNDLENVSNKQIDICNRKLELADHKIRELISLLEKKDIEINELIKHNKKIDKDCEGLISMKDMEINNLNQKLNFANETINRLNLQLNSMSINTNSITQDLRRELKILEEKNKELEIKIFQKEKILSDKDIELMKNKTNLYSDNVSPSSIDLVLKSKLDNQNKLISSLNNEIVSIKYTNEKLVNDLNEEREINQKLQLSIAEVKYKYNNSKNNNLLEDLAVQTMMKGENIDQLNNKLSSKENEILKLNESIQNVQKENQKLKDKKFSLEKENKKLCDELNTILKKMNLDKKKNINENYERELIYNIANVSKLNKTITFLKMKELEYLERIQTLESYCYEREVPKAENNLKKQNSNNSEKRVHKSLIHNNDENTVVSFNVSEQSIIERGINNNSKVSHLKDIHSRDSEMNKILEDNVLLKNNMFTYISEIQNLQNIINNFREKYINIVK